MEQLVGATLGGRRALKESPGLSTRPIDPAEVVLCQCGCPSHVDTYDATGDQVGACRGCEACERFERAFQELKEAHMRFWLGLRDPIGRERPTPEEVVITFSKLKRSEGFLLCLFSGEDLGARCRITRSAGKSKNSVQGKRMRLDRSMLAVPISHTRFSEPSGGSTSSGRGTVSP